MALDDIEDLRRHIMDTYGKPNRVFLDGARWGGHCDPLAETHAGDYAGALAIGLVGTNYNHEPQMPLLLLSNQNEAPRPSFTSAGPWRRRGNRRSGGQARRALQHHQR